MPTKRTPAKKTGKKPKIAKPARKPAAAKKAAPIKKPAGGLNWANIEKTLFALCAKTIQTFAKKHADEIFYALFLDFAADWTQIRMHLSTPAILRQRAEEYIRSNPEHYARRSVEAVANDIRWEPGDFGYFDINNTRGWKMKWTPIADKLHKAANKQDAGTYASGDFVELQYLLTVTRVLLRLESEGALGPLKRTRNFRICCMRPEERPDDAWRRMTLVRRQMLDARPSAGSAARR